MTFPKALKERLILVAYLTPYSFIVILLCRYEPAKSTKFSFPTLNLVLPWASVVCSSIFMVNMQCDRDDSLFIDVCLIERFL
jgi:hypothetical protein